MLDIDVIQENEDIVFDIVFSAILDARHDAIKCSISRSVLSIYQ
jgi:hypothetical protein